MAEKPAPAPAAAPPTAPPSGRAEQQEGDGGGWGQDGWDDEDWGDMDVRCLLHFLLLPIMYPTSIG